MLIPLKKKYLVAKPRGHKSSTSNSLPKKKSIWKKLEEAAKKGHLRTK